MTIEILGIRGNELTFLRDGKRTTWTGSTATAKSGELRTEAAKMVERAEDLVLRAAVLRAAANFKDVQEVEAKAAANKQRNERAAATRARNADPFGFDAILARNDA